MLRILARPTLIAAALLASYSLVGDRLNAAAPAPVANADAPSLISDYPASVSDSVVTCRPRPYGRPDLFYNFYMPPNCGGVGAQLYIAPRPVPPLVGHTYYTYQPLMPHEMLYRHYRYYHRHYDGGRGLTRTRVIWW